jgi:hypothetical protein
MGALKGGVGGGGDRVEPVIIQKLYPNRAVKPGRGSGCRRQGRNKLNRRRKTSELFKRRGLKFRDFLSTSASYFGCFFCCFSCLFSLIVLAGFFLASFLVSLDLPMMILLLKLNTSSLNFKYSQVNPQSKNTPSLIRKRTLAGRRIVSA